MMETTVIAVMSETEGKNKAERNCSENTTLYKDSGKDACSKCKSAANLLQKRRQLNPLMCTVTDSPYQASITYGARFNSSSKTNMADYSHKIASAKVLRVKQLQNDLRDAQFQLNELATENRLLKTLQKRQDLALKKYEDQKAELPQLIHSHNEEVRVLRAKVKQLKAQGREKDHRIKELDADLQSLKDQHYHLLKLSKDQQLVEREQLSRQVEDLKEIIQDQDAKIQILNRKILLESKNFKHQLAAEMVRHKETGRSLKEALSKITQLEMLVASKEKYIATYLPKRLNQNKSSASVLSLAESSRFPVLHSSIKTETEFNSQLEEGISGGAYMVLLANKSDNSYLSHVTSEHKVSQDGYNARRDKLANMRKSMLERIQPESKIHKINNLAINNAHTLSSSSSSSSSSSLQNDQENLDVTDEDTNKYASLCDSNSSQNTVTSRRQSSDSGRRTSVEHSRIKELIKLEGEHSEITTDESLKEDKNSSPYSRISDTKPATGINRNNFITELNDNVDTAVATKSSTDVISKSVESVDSNKISRRRGSLLELKSSFDDNMGNDFTLTPKLISRRRSLNITKKSHFNDDDVSESSKESLRTGAVYSDMSVGKYLNNSVSEGVYFENERESRDENSTPMTYFNNGDGNNNKTLAETCQHLHEISQSYRKIQYSLETEKKKVEDKIQVVDNIESASLENKHFQKEKLLAALKAIDEGKDPAEFKKQNDSPSVLENVMNNSSSNKNISLPFVGPVRILDSEVMSRDINRTKSKLGLMQELFGEHSVDHKS